jgi:hypothetical protein
MTENATIRAVVLYRSITEKVRPLPDKNKLRQKFHTRTVEFGQIIRFLAKP